MFMRLSILLQLDLLNICHPLKEILKRDQLIWQHFPVFLFIILYEVV